MNATTVLEPKVVGEKTKEKVLKLLTKQLKQQKKRRALSRRHTPSPSLQG